MKAKQLIALQLTSFIIMVGAAENLFEKILPSIIFIVSVVVFIKCSLYINRNWKRLLQE